MSLRLEMLQVARLSHKVLGDSAKLARNFLIGQINEDGGFKNRAGSSDLYYPVFGLEGLIALEAESLDLPVQSPKSKVQSPELHKTVERTQPYLRSFGCGDDL